MVCHLCPPRMPYLLIDDRYLVVRREQLVSTRDGTCRIRHCVSNEQKYTMMSLTSNTNICRAELYPPPDTLPSNVSLVLGDLTKELPAEWTANFDLVHQRFIFPSFPVDAVERILERLASCVRPGGWIQLVEPAANENVSGPGPSAFTTLHQIASRFMKCPSPKEVILSQLTKLGFININVHSVDIVIGKFQDNRELDFRGRKSMRAAFNNMYKMTRQVSQYGLS